MCISLIFIRSVTVRHSALSQSPTKLSDQYHLGTIYLQNDNQEILVAREGRLKVLRM